MALRNIIQDKGSAYKIAAFLSVLILLAGLIFAAVFERSTKHPFLSIAGLPEGSTSRVEMQQAGKQITLASLPNSHSPAFAAPENMMGDYKITATLTSGPRYQDLQILVGKKQVRIIASGFDPAEEITVKSNSKTVLSNLHFDWSGKIELTQDLAKDESYLCFTAGTDLTVCHSLPAEVGA